MLPTSVYSLFFYNLTFLISDCIFFMYSVFPVTLSFLLLCLFSFSFSVIFSLCHSFFPIILPLYHSVFFVILSLLLLCLYVILSLVILSFLLFCLYVILSLLCLYVSFHLFVALPPPFFPSHFGFIFTLSSVYFLIFLPEYLSI